MKKQGLVTACLLLLSTVAYADSNRGFDGFFTGISAGSSIMTGKIHDLRTVNNVTTLHFPPAITVTSINKTDTFSTMYLRKNSVIGTLYTGYGFSCNDTFYLGAEAFIDGNEGKRVSFSSDNFSNNSQTSNVSFIAPTSSSAISPWSATIKFKNWGGGIDLRPGFLLTCDTLFYGRVGFTTNKISTKGFFSIRINDPFFGPNYNPSVSVNHHKKHNALRLGFGLEQKIFSCLNIRVDYIYTNYRKVTAQGTSFNTITLPASASQSDRTIVTTLSDQISSRLQRQAIMLGLNYYW
jgi:opacity protein-like surface antigen